MNRKYLLILFTWSIFAFPGFAQTAPESFPEEITLHFLLEGEPTPQDAGFDDSQSYWKVSYELYSADFSALQKLGFGKTDKGFRFLPPIFQNKKYNQRIKKNSTKILRGSFRKKSLANAVNRDVAINVKLLPAIVGIFNQAMIAPDKNPTFILMVTEKVSVKNPGGLKLKDKYRTTGFSPLKYPASNGTFENTNVRNLSLTANISKQENNQLKLTVFLLH